jgi:TRAP-type transport system periplasmic protein
MNRRRSRRAFLASLGAFVPLSGPFYCGAAAADAYTLRLSLASAANSVNGDAAVRFAVAVKRRSNGQLNVAVYPNGQLATQQGAIDGLTTGVIDFTVGASSFLVPLFPRYQVFDMPFLFKNLAAGLRVLDGPIGAEFFAELEPKGIVGLGWGINGLKELETTAKPVVTPEDMKGLRIRIQGGGVFVATYQALGAIPVPIDFAETNTALQQHTVDAVDLPVDVFTASKFYITMKHVAMTNHTLSVIPLLGSKRKIEALPLALQKTIKEAAKEIVPGWRDYLIRQTSEEVQFLKKNGVVFTETQYPAFHKAVEPVYASYQSKLGGDLIERIGRAAG